jgi:hypothetical protein
MGGRKFCILLLVLAFFSTAFLCEAGEKMLYRLEFEKGQKYHMRMITEQNVSQTVMDQEQKAEQTIGMGIDMDVNDVDSSGNAWVRYAYTWMKMRQKGPMGEILYDSSQKDLSVHPMAQGFAALLGESFSANLTPKGQVEAVKGLEQMRSNILGRLPEGPMREYMVKSLEQFLSEEAIKEFTESSMAVYPDEPVGVGDSWNKTLVLTLGVPMIVENEWTLKQRKDGVGFIDVQSTIKPNLEAKPMEMGSMKMSYEISGEQQGVIEIKESTGQMIRSKLTQQLSGQMKMKVDGEEPTEMTLPMKIDGVVTIEMTERGERGPE